MSQNFLQGEFQGLFQVDGDEPHGLNTPAIKIAFEKAADGSEVKGTLTLYKAGTLDVQECSIDFEGEGLKMGPVVELGFDSMTETAGLEGSVFVRMTPNEQGLVLHGRLRVSAPDKQTRHGNITAFRSLQM